MILINAQCTYCGEKIHVNPDKPMGTCHFYCLQYETDRAIENYKESGDKGLNSENILVAMVVVIGMIVFCYATLLVSS